MAVWIVFFGAMTALGATDGRHRGDTLPFWQQACQDNRRNACTRLVQLESSYCDDNAGWACNELGRHYMEGRIVAADPDRALTVVLARLRGAVSARLRQPAASGATLARPIRAPSTSGCCCARPART